MTLYAYCNSSLRDHSLNVLERLEQTFIDRGDTRVLCRKIVSSINTRDYMGRSGMENELINTCIDLTRLGAVLHDIGKGVLLYQNPGLHVIVDGKCGASYPFHEVFSGIVVYRLVKRYLVKYVRVKPLLMIPVIITLYHHYTMERLNLSDIIEYVYQRFGGEVIFHPELEKIMLDLSSRALENIVLTSDVVRRRKILGPIKAGDIQALFKYIGENYLAHKRILLLSMGLVGQVAIIDYITASIERKGGSKYLKNLCSEAGWLCRGLDI